MLEANLEGERRHVDLSISTFSPQPSSLEALISFQKGALRGSQRGVHSNGEVEGKI